MRFLFCVLLALVPLRVAAAPYAFIPSATHSVGSLIDLANDEILANIAVGRGAYSVVWHPDGRRIFVSNSLDSTISVIAVDPDAPSRASVSDLIHTGAGLTLLAMDPGGEYLAVASTDTVSLYRLDDYSLANSAAIPHPAGMVIRAGVMYVTSASTNTVVRLAIPSLATLASQGTGVTPGAIGISPDGAEIYVANFESNTVSVIRTPGFSLESNVAVGTNPQAVAVSPDGSSVYVASADGTVSIIRTSNRTVSHTLESGSNPFAVAFHPTGAYAYVVNNGNSNYARIDTSSEVVDRTASVFANPTGIPGFVSPGYASPICTLTASPTSVSVGTSSTLTPSCSPEATSYTWNGGTCAGTTGPTCTVKPSVTTTYSVTGRNSVGGVGNTATATVTVSTPAVRTLGSRGTVTPGATLYGGFQLSAPSTVYLMVRGNSLGTLGITSNFLDAPRVRLLNAQNQDLLSDINGVGFNGCTSSSNSGAAVVSYYTSVRGAPPQPRDACTAQSLPAGVYTFTVTPSSTGTVSSPSSGEVLFEVTLGGGTGSAASTLGSRGTVSRTATLFGGFELVNPATILVLVRGNSLGTLGITQSFLDAPRMRLFNQQGQDLLSDINGNGTNGCSSAFTAQAAVVNYYTTVRGAPPSARDSCTFQQLPAGAYTFTVTPSTQGVISNPSSGETLFEVTVQ